ncbi:MAG: response regulator [Geothrix sp.]|uniref:HD domain-containing phosphohydrolase n=1 Tax=Geothrix sp. TaxID=1962974 RepID=UPI00180616C4|nr:HD domain-containing phosphohydrolase [Geothrix sp.]NWJ39932.1 response regulator [Geothrix sp.]WIL22056.1 MAG: response regulator [Geothrix sp.]
MKPKILLVDDEANVLQAYARVLRGRFALDTALGGEAALECMADRGPYAVVVSDMRMPGMDGVTFLAWSMAQHPDTVRIMLTGNADQGTAMEAVNRGSIFRFLTKPCDSELLSQTLDLAVRQHQLITAEKSLVEDTLKGAIRMLVELLSCLDPISFGRAQAMAAHAEAIAREMSMENPWVLGIASILSQIGILTVPEGVATKLQTGTFLTSAERDLANRIPEIGADLIRNIPRLEEVAEAVLYMNKNLNGTGYPPDDKKDQDIPLGGRILRVVWDYERLLPKFSGPLSALRDMEGRTTWYDLDVLRAFKRCLEREDTEAPSTPTQRIGLHELRIGHVLLAGIETVDGLLVVPEATVIGLAHLQKLRNFARLSGIREPLIVKGEPA